MPVPVTWADLSITPANNSPKGSEPVGTQMDDYLRSAFAFLKQLHDGWLAADGTVTWTGNQNANGKAITNLVNPTNPQDACTKAYADSLITYFFPRGVVILWYGQIASCPPGWLICNGNNGTPDMRDRVPYGAGGSVGVPVYGGVNSYALTTANMPIHSHQVNDPGHAHNVSDGGHGHGLSDPGHGHTLPNLGSVQAGGDNGGAQCPVATGYSSGRGQAGTNPSGTGISIYAANANISIYSAGTGIYLSNAGGGAAFDTRSAWGSFYFIMKA